MKAAHIRVVIAILLTGTGRVSEILKQLFSAIQRLEMEQDVSDGHRRIKKIL